MTFAPRDDVAEAKHDEESWFRRAAKHAKTTRRLVRRARALSLAEDHQPALSTGQRAFALLKPLEDGGAWPSAPSKQPAAAAAAATALPHLTLDVN